MGINMECKDCRFWRAEGHLGSCKRFPKALTKSHSDWCGEYKGKEEMLTLPVVDIPEKRKPGRPAKGDKNGE